MSIKARKTLDHKKVLSQVPTIELFQRYSRNFREIDIKFKSDLREENNPSCVVTQYGGDLLYTDFGLGRSFRIVDFVMELYGLSFYDAIEKIDRDNSGMSDQDKADANRRADHLLTGISQYEERKPTIIKIKSRDWTIKDLNYWKQYYIPTPVLNQYNVKSISKYWLKRYKDEDFVSVNIGALGRAYCFDYYWNKGVLRRKIYFPDRKFNRFISNVDKTIVQGWDNLPKQGGQVLFITSSMKDVLVFKILGFYAVAPNNETSFIPEKVFKKLQERWKYIIIWYDNDFDKEDNTGLLNAKKYSEHFNIPYFKTPDNTAKDPSDYIKNYGPESLLSVVNSQLKHLY